MKTSTRRDYSDPNSTREIEVLEILQDLMTAYMWLGREFQHRDVHDHCIPFQQGMRLLEENGKDCTDFY